MQSPSVWQPMVWSPVHLPQNFEVWPVAMFIVDGVVLRMNGFGIVVAGMKEKSGRHSTLGDPLLVSQVLAEVVQMFAPQSAFE